jgi:anti-sigma regulatory factor (Ser/Thr protein kinase)
MHNQEDALCVQVLREYLNDAMCANGLAELWAHIQNKLNLLLSFAQCTLYLRADDTWMRMDVQGDVVKFLPVTGESGVVRMVDAAVADKCFSWHLKEGEERCAALPLVCGTKCWGCIWVGGIQAENTRSQCAAAEKIAECAAVQLLPMVEECDTRGTALKLLKENALIMLSADLKSPLILAEMTMREISEKLKKHDESIYNAEYAALFSKWENTVRIMLRLTDNLFEIGRLEEGCAILSPTWHDAEELVREIVDSVVPYAQMKNVSLQFVSALREPVELYTDENSVARILINLLANALVAATRSAQAPTVSITLASYDSGVAVSVRDNGPGILPEDKPHVFEKLWQRPIYGDQRKQGIGLGLYLSHRLAQTLQAVLAVEDCPQGACFTLRLPLLYKEPQGAGRSVRSLSAPYIKSNWRERLDTEMAMLSLLSTSAETE